MPKMKETIRQRIGWEAHLQPFLYKALPANLGWSATLGSLCALLFALMAVSGMFLAMYYSPSPDRAYQSIDYIMTQVPLGPILRGIHHWGAAAMVLAVATHLATVFFSGAFKAPRELTWAIGVGLLLATLGLGFTGYLLPWDQKAYWATVVSASKWGENPEDYVGIEIKVAESKYTAWPPAVRELFEPARTLQTGNPTYKLEQLKPGVVTSAANDSMYCEER